MRSIAVLLFSLVSLVGCTSARHAFMGVPDDQVQTIEQKNPEVDHRLRGITVMTKVESVDYRKYADWKREGRIIAEERRGSVVYFAIGSSLHVPIAAAGADTAGGAYVDVTERHKAVIPE